MINEKQKQWRKASKQSTYRDIGVMEALRQLYGSTNKVGCCVCSEEEPELLGIYPHDSYEKEWHTLCNKCHGATRQYFDNGLQKQIGGVNV